MYIYKTTNTLNGKIYIGLSSKQVEESEDYLGSGVILNQAINKYGKEHFTKEILERDIENYDLLIEREIYWIKELESKVEHGNYNMTDGGQGALGKSPDIETRKKMSEAITELWKDPGYRAKMRETRKDPEHRARMDEVRKETWKDPGLRAKMSALQKELWKDPAHRAKMSATLKELYKDPERRAKMSEVSKETWKDPEYKAKMSEVHKELWKDPEHRAKMSEANKEAWKDPELRAKHSEAIKEALKDPERRAKMSALQKGKQWWYNPETGKCAMTKESMPSPWIRGRGKKKH